MLRNVRLFYLLTKDTLVVLFCWWNQVLAKIVIMILNMLHNEEKTELQLPFNVQFKFILGKKILHNLEKNIILIKLYFIVKE